MYVCVSVFVCTCVCETSHSSALHGVANDHNDTPFVVLDSCRRTLHKFTIRTERCAEGNVDAARNMASAEAGVSGVKEHNFKKVQYLPGTRAKV